VSPTDVRHSIPNALTIVRFAAIPVFVWLYLEAAEGAAWGAGLFFVGAAVTDQIDGYLARRWHVESRFGTIADPLADRLMIDAAVIALFLHDRLPWIALVLVVGRDIAMIAGYKLVVPRGYSFDVSFLGKLATWLLYASLCFVMVTEAGTDWPLWLFWTGVVLAVIAGALYVAKAFREVRAP
jgi:CDP-diacylglycerol--glycerol-3-phosphate 3-phosphatidyltransferase